MCLSLVCVCVCGRCAYRYLRVHILYPWEQNLPEVTRMKPTTYLLQIASTLITEPRTSRAETVTTVTTTAGLWSLDPEATRENKTEQGAEAGRGLIRLPGKHQRLLSQTLGRSPSPWAYSSPNAHGGHWSAEHLCLFVGMDALLQPSSERGQEISQLGLTSAYAFQGGRDFRSSVGSHPLFGVPFLKEYPPAAVR